MGTVIGPARRWTIQTGSPAPRRKPNTATITDADQFDPVTANNTASVRT